MYAKITADHLYDGRWITTNRTNDVVIGTGPTAGLLDIRLLDDDRELYYEAKADDEALEDLFDWAQRDAGVTILQVRHGAVWKDEIS